MNYIEYNESDIQSFEYETTINSDKNIVGTCELGKATIQMLNDSNEYSSLKESWIQTVHGSFYIYDVAPIQERVNIKLDCYDIKYKLDKPYDSSKHMFPCTIKEWRNSIFEDCEVEYDDSDFPNSDLVLEEEPYIGDNQSNRNVICKIAQAGMSFVVTDETDKFYFNWFEETVHIASDWSSLTTEKGLSKPVNAMVLGRGEVEDNVSYPNTLPTIPIEFRIDNNYILDSQNTESEYDQRYDVIQPLYDRINGFSYLIFNMTTQNIENKLSVKLGQKVKYLDIWDNELEAYIMTKKIIYLGGDLSNDDNYQIILSASEIKETSTELSYSSSIKNDVLEVRRLADKMNGKIEDTVKAVTESTQKVVEVEKKVDTSIKEITPYYAISSSNTIAPTSGWSTTMPNRGINEYLWRKDLITYQNDQSEYTIPYMASGDKGNDGAIGPTGPKGDVGEKGNGYILVEGTQTATTASWTGVTNEIEELVAGTQILYHLPQTSSSNVTLNLTLADGSNTGAINVYFSNTTRLGTQYAIGAMIALIYDGQDWRVVNPYTNSNTYDRIKFANSIKAAAAITASSIIVGTASGYKKAAANVEFDINYPILWATSAIASGATGTNNYTAMPSCTLRNNKSGITLSSYRMAYLVGTLTGNIFKIDSEVFSTGPTQADGRHYIPVGFLYSTYQVYFEGGKPTIYAYGENGFTLMPGEKGETGDAGTGVDSITTEFYLSTSKETQENGEWVTTMPSWENGKYLWTRNKIVYKNPSSTVYTEPCCDSSYDAINEVEDDLKSEIKVTEEKIAQTNIDVDNIKNTVSNTTTTLDNNIELLKQQMTQLQQTANSLAISITSINQDGVSKVVTSTGFVFDENGLKLSKDGEAMSATLNWEGLLVKNYNTDLLDARGDRVIAENLTVKKYLITGRHRFEKFTDEKNRLCTGLFWVGD